MAESKSRGWKLCFTLVSFIITCAVLLSCQNDTTSGSGSSVSANDKPTDNSAALSYDFVTQNRSFMGGSLIYNPTLNNQLSAGTKIGVRLGTLTTSYEDVQMIAGVDYTSDESIDIEINENGIVSNKSNISFISETQIVYEDDPTKARYGFLDITSVDADSISFSFIEFSADGTSHTDKTFTIGKGEECDINNDGISDLAYNEPPIVRTGYADARWLTFLCVEESCRTTMYSTYAQSEKNANYTKNTDSSVAVIPDEGLYGVNSDGRFIFIEYQDDTGRSGSGSRSGGRGSEQAAFGDFVIGCSSSLMTSDLSAKVSEADRDLQDIELESPTLKLDSKCKTVIPPSQGMFNYIDYDNYKYEYQYRPNQFPDQDNGPKALLDQLCENEEVKTEIVRLNNDSETFPTEARPIITLLNNILRDKNAVKTIAYQNGAKEEYDDLSSDQNIVIAGNAYARRIIDKYYSQSPKSDISSPELENIFPYFYANIGNSSNSRKLSQPLNSVYFAPQKNADSRSVATSSYNDYEAKVEEIEKRLDDFLTIPIFALVFDDGGHLSLHGDLGLLMLICLTGSVSVSSKKASVKMGVALYIQINADYERSENYDQYIAKLIKGIVSEPVEKQVMLGPVPCVFGTRIVLGLNVDVKQTPNFCFTGLYGGEAAFGAEYGIKWKWFIPYPYIKPFCSGSPIYETALYVGDGPIDYTWGPYIKLIPSAGIGWSLLSARVSLPAVAWLGIRSVRENDDLVFDSVNLELKESIEPFVEVKITNQIRLKYNIASYKLIGGTLRLYPTPLKWTFD